MPRHTFETAGCEPDGASAQNQRQAVYDEDADVLLTSFDTAYVRAIHPDLLGQESLRPVAGVAFAFDPEAELDQHGVLFARLFHMPMILLGRWR